MLKPALYHGVKSFHCLKSPSNVHTISNVLIYYSFLLVFIRQVLDAVMMFLVFMQISPTLENGSMNNFGSKAASIKYVRRSMLLGGFDYSRKLQLEWILTFKTHHNDRIVNRIDSEIQHSIFVLIQFKSIHL